MNGELPNFKVGGVVLNNDKKDNSMVSLNGSDTSFVVLARDVRESLQNSTPNDEQVPQCSLNEPGVFLSASHIRRIESRLHQMEEENAKLNKMLEESDAAMKQKFEKVEAWQKEVMSVCQDHNQKYLGTKKLVERMRAENDFLLNCVKLQSSTTPTALTASTGNKQPLVQNDSSTNAIITLPIQTRDSSLDNEMMVISLQKTAKTTPTAETQCISSTETSTKTESVTDTYDDTQTPVAESQKVNAETSEIKWTMNHSSLNVSQSANPADMSEKLYKLLEENRIKPKENFQLLLKESINQFRANDFSGVIASESDDSHTEQRNSTHEGEMLNELKKLLDDERKSYKKQHIAMAKENILLRRKCDTLEIDLKNCNTKLIDTQKTITELRKQSIESQYAARGNETNQSAASKPDVWKPEELVQRVFSEEQAKTEALYKKIHNVINEFTPQGIDTFVNQVHELEIDTLERLQGVIDLIFEKSINNPNYAFACVLMCKELSYMEVASDADNSSSANFRKLFLTRCQTEFEKNFTVNKNTCNAKLRKIDECTDLKTQEEFRINFEQEKLTKRLNSLGNIILIGELFNRNMLTYKIMNLCICDLLIETNDINIECLCILMITIGKRLNAIMWLDDYFERLKQIAKQKDKIKWETQSLVEDVINFKINKWAGYEMYLKLWIKCNMLQNKK